MNKRIVLTGGGTAGHVTPNLALIDIFKQDGWQIDYIGSVDGVEKSMIAAVNIPYHAIRCGKLRRYFSWKNFIDPFNMLIGIVQAYFLLRKIKANIVFSKGGFVALPVVVAAWLNNIPVIAHESDLSPGLANRLSFPFVDTICVTFEAGKQFFKHQHKVLVTGTPIRSQLLNGSAMNGLARCGFQVGKPVLLIVGGSQGAAAINRCVRQALDALTQQFQIIHLCGKGKLDASLMNKPGYCQLEYANDELADLFAASDVVVSRAGANSLYEILALGKPHVLIPLPLHSSRGDQIQNAKHFQQQGISVVVEESQLQPDTLLDAIDKITFNRDAIVSKIKRLNIKSATDQIVEMINLKLSTAK